jgi:hypothetical protein
MRAILTSIKATRTVPYEKLIDPEVNPITHTQKVKVFSTERKPQTYSTYLYCTSTLVHLSEKVRKESIK